MKIIPEKRRANLVKYIGFIIESFRFINQCHSTGTFYIIRDGVILDEH
jgi:hypothetical protein